MPSSFQVIHQIQKTVFDHISKEKRKDDLTVHVMHAIACHKQITKIFTLCTELCHYSVSFLASITTEDWLFQVPSKLAFSVNIDCIRPE